MLRRILFALFLIITLYLLWMPIQKEEHSPTPTAPVTFEPAREAPRDIKPGSEQVEPLTEKATPTGLQEDSDEAPEIDENIHVSPPDKKQGLVPGRDIKDLSDEELEKLQLSNFELYIREKQRRSDSAGLSAGTLSTQERKVEAQKIMKERVLKKLQENQGSKQ